jgi:hypothetical protein
MVERELPFLPGGALAARWPVGEFPDSELSLSPTVRAWRLYSTLVAIFEPVPPASGD